MPASWTPLRLASESHELPPLLLSADFTSTSYAIHLTDLTNIWSEELDIRAIRSRSNDENTSIDACESLDQLAVLLAKIRDGLLNKLDADISLETASSTEADLGPELKMSITIALPSGLAPLKWPITLKPQPQSKLTDNLIIPLLKAQDAKTQELESLMHIVAEKDHVISKLVDKLESSGIELGNVFAAAAGRGGRKLSREAAEERVKGLRVFDKKAWRENITYAQTDTQDVKALLHTILKSEKTLAPHDDSAPASETWGKWWSHIRGKLQVDNTTTMDEPSPSQEPVLRENRIDEDEDLDSFQVQATPPQGRRSKHTSKPNDETQQTTVADSFPSSLPKQSPPKTKVTKLGGLKRAKATTASKSPSPVQPPPSHQEQHEDDDATLSEAPPTATPTVTPTATPTASPTASPAVSSKRTASPERIPEKETTTKPVKRRLGQLGGVRANASQTPLEDDSPPVESSSQPKRKHKLGGLGPKPKTADIKTSPKAPQRPMSKDPGDEGTQGGGEDTRGRPAVRAAPKEPTPPRLTSKERAEANRARLKRELEEKQKAPVKKKRKF